MKKVFLYVLTILFITCTNIYAAGNIVDRGASSTEVTAQERDDIYLTPSSVPYIVRPQSVNKSANATLTAIECSGTLITNYGWNGTADGDQTFTLPAAEEGLEFLFLNLVTHATADLYFDPADNTTQIVLDGVACGNDERVWTDNATAYESIHFYTFSVNATAYDWAADSVNGVWSDKGS
jgi:hypothetical protein